MRELRASRRRLMGLAASVACQAALAATAAANSPSPVEVKIGAGAASIANPCLAWEMSLADGRVRTSTLTNRRTGATMQPVGQEFVVELADGQRLEASDFKFERAGDQPVAGGGECLVIELSRGPLRVRLATQIRPNEWWATRWLEISDNAGGLAAVTFSSWRCARARGPDPTTIAGGAWQHSLGLANGFGQPVYCDDLFLGIAHPGAQNIAGPDGVSFRLPCYEALVPGRPVRTREFVVGAGEAGTCAGLFSNI